jgi:flagellar basal body-associated protein FliL
MEENNRESNDVVAKDAELPEQSSSIVGDTPLVATSKKKKIIMLGCGFCVLLFLVCAGIGLPMVAKLRQAVEDVNAENAAEMQRLEEQYEMESNYEETLEADANQASGSTDDEDQED